jgi:hypothetical protein
MYICRKLGDIHVLAGEGATDDFLAAGVEVNVRGLFPN